MSKKIGILTFHYADNYGAVLQAYALRKVLNKFPGYEAEIINYVPEGYEYKVYLEEDLVKLCVERRKKIESFLVKNCMVRSPMIHTLKETHYDYYCVGSDQVWNIGLPEAQNQAYFLGEISDTAIRFSYAASIGTRIDEIDEQLFRKYIPKFSYVGIREQSYIKKINNICNVNCVHNIDPTLLLQKKDYDELINNYGKQEGSTKNQESYILYIWFGEDALQSIELVNSIARKYESIVFHNFISKQIVARKMLYRDGGYIFNKGIEELLWYIKHAAFVITNSYHVGIFSLIFERPVYFYAFEGRESRQMDLAETLGIKERIVKGYIKPDNIDESMDYNVIGDSIKREREHSLSYLKRILL